MASDRIKTKHSARLRLVHGEDCEGCQDIGLQKALHIVHLAGWRIVRTDDADTFDPPADYVWTRDSGDPPTYDRSGVFYHDEDRPEGCTPLWRISDEWTPDNPATPAGAGVAAGPQATPRVLGEGKTTPARLSSTPSGEFEDQISTLRIDGLVDLPPGTHYRVVTAPTSQEDQP